MSAHKLTKWRRLLLLRDIRYEDEIRRSYCVMCNLTMPTWRIQCHHVRPLSIRPDLAYDLFNGVCLCLSCHMGVVHGGNSFKDLAEIHNWKVFVPSFDRHVSLSVNRRYNARNQERI